MGKIFREVYSQTGELLERVEEEVPDSWLWLAEASSKVADLEKKPESEWSNADLRFLVKYLLRVLRG